MGIIFTCASDMRSRRNEAVYRAKTKLDKVKRLVLARIRSHGINHMAEQRSQRRPSSLTIIARTNSTIELVENGNSD